MLLLYSWGKVVVVKFLSDISCITCLAEPMNAGAAILIADNNPKSGDPWWKSDLFNLIVGEQTCVHYLVESVHDFLVKS